MPTATTSTAERWSKSAENHPHDFTMKRLSFATKLMSEVSLHLPSSKYDPDLLFFPLNNVAGMTHIIACNEQIKGIRNSERRGDRQTRSDAGNVPYRAANTNPHSE
jgi:hypothetical protein